MSKVTGVDDLTVGNLTVTGSASVPGTTNFPYGSPLTNGLIAANFDPLYATATVTPMTPGVLYLAMVRMGATDDLGNLVYTLGGAATSPTTGQCFIGVYEGAASGNLLASTADLSTAWGSAGDKNSALAAPTPSKSVGTPLYVAFLFNGTTAPTLRGITGSTKANINIASLPRFATAGSALTALPSTLPALTASTVAAWIGAL